MEGLDILEPAPTEVPWRGRTLRVTPLTVGQLPAFARAIRPASGAAEAFLDGRQSLTMAGALDLIAEHGEALILAVSIASGVAREELESSTPDQLIGLAAAVIRVNADFFGRRLTPALRAAVPNPPAQSDPGAGPMPSP